MTAQPTIDENKLDEFVGKFVADMGAAMHASTVLIGDKLGLYKAMADGVSVTPKELAERTETDERYVREWLAAQAASGYTEYDPATERFHLTPEQAFALANEHNPVFVPGGFQTPAAAMRDVELMVEAFRTGEGVGWHQHDHELFEGTERFFRSNYVANLTTAWIPALDGALEKLETGAKVADIGCGHGASTILLAKEYPNSTFYGFDYHEASIERAREAAEEAGVADRCTFEVASAKDYPGEGYDLAMIFDALHDMGDPVGAAAHIKQTLDPDGALMIVEPYAGDHLEDNLNPVGRIFYSASINFCVPGSKDQEVGLALGAQAGEGRVREVVTEGGFTRFRRAAETPFNLVFEARP